MKLYTLSSNPNKPCNVLRFKKATLMLDCSLDMASVLNFLPLTLVKSIRLSSLPNWNVRDANDLQIEGEFKECSGRVFVDSAPEFSIPQHSLINYGELDAILISNYTCMLALPYITERHGFKGTVYATEPTLQFGRLFMEELLKYVERSPSRHKASRWKSGDILRLLPPPLCDVFKPHLLQACFTLKEMNACLSKVQIVAFSERIDIYGAVSVTPVSSGYCLGSCNWVIQSNYEKVVYMSGSSAMTSHTKPMDQVSIKNADVFILTSLTKTPTCNPDSMLGEFCMTVALTVRNGGNVLVPCTPSGVIYDLFECISMHFENSGLMSIPIYFISPVAVSSLTFSNIYAEWLSDSKQSKVYLPDEPFTHGHLTRCGRLHHFPSLDAENFVNEFRSPCVVFTGHPMLRFGDVVHFMELWGGSHQNLVAFIDADVPYLDALAPYQPLLMKAVHYPIDTSLNYAQANKIIKEAKPRHLVIPEQYSMPPLMHPHRSDLVIESVNPIMYKRSSILSLPVKRKYEQIDVEPQLAASLVPNEVKFGVALATVSGMLEAKDNKFYLKSMSDECAFDQMMSSKPAVGSNLIRQSKYHSFGSLNIDKFVQKLAEEGITDAKVEHTETGVVIHLRDEDSIIQIEDNSTHIFCQGDEKLRRALRSVLVECLNKF